MSRTPGKLGRNIPPITKYPTLFAGRNTHVAQIVSKNEADADFIVKAWNTHDELVAALLAVRLRMQGMAIYSTDQETGETFATIVDAALAKVKENT